MKMGPDWKRIASTMGLKNQNEAFAEFLKLKSADLFVGQL